jgi:hypothetical protein
MKANTILKYTLVAALASVCLVSCVSSGDNTGIEYAPNMYISQAYEPFSQEKNFDYNPNGMTMRSYTLMQILLKDMRRVLRIFLG